MILIFNFNSNMRSLANGNYLNKQKIFDLCEPKLNAMVKRLILRY